MRIAVARVMNRCDGASLFINNNPVNSLSAELPITMCEPDTSEPSDTRWSAASVSAGVRAGNEAAFKELHRQYASRLTRYALVIARGNEHVAAETVQNTFLRAIRSLKRVPDDDALWSWLAKAARCAAVDGARRERRYTGMLSRFVIVRADDSVPGEDPEATWLHALEASVAELSDDDQRLIHARYTERVPLIEIAARTATTDRAVERRLARIRESLRTTILNRLTNLP